MEGDFHTQAVTEAVTAAGHEADAGLINVSGPMMGLTWVTFALVALILYKVAWKPILIALDMREQGIRRALEDAEKARREAAASEERNRKLIQDAEQEARRIVAEARAAAESGAQQLREEAEQRARKLAEETRRDIAAAAEHARETLRRETADLTVRLTAKVLGRKVDEAANRELIQESLREIAKS